jgi:hypothetical protein
VQFHSLMAPGSCCRSSNRVLMPCSACQIGPVGRRTARHAATCGPSHKWNEEILAKVVEQGPNALFCKPNRTRLTLHHFRNAGH